jgi:hypothetical protein
MIVIEVKKNAPDIIGALCQTLGRHYPNMSMRWDKPRMSTKTIITIKGDNDEERVLEDFQCFFSVAGWKIEVKRG